MLGSVTSETMFNINILLEINIFAMFVCLRHMDSGKSSIWNQVLRSPFPTYSMRA